MKVLLAAGSEIKECETFDDIFDFSVWHLKQCEKNAPNNQDEGYWNYQMNNVIRWVEFGESTWGQWGPMLLHRSKS